MKSVSPGFRGRRRGMAERLPPGQYPTEGWPVLSAGPTPAVQKDTWEFALTTEKGEERRWSWDQMMDLPQQEPVADIHCVTRWSKFDTRWRGVSMDTFFEEVEPDAGYAMFESYGGYTTNVPVADLREGQAWLVHTYDGYPLAPEHGGPARMLIPHLYFWKSAKWVRGVRLMPQDQLGFWEQMGYHAYGDPWREQRVRGD
ncbi:molybdopterin-dependent oxidoreductase [Streptomyces sp. SBT349]|uniref:molybdopterin-dependent oxidoreductase n=1 Tax=Streptomyces sp. SBT349 TaxID=1580539 RepID=UPI00066C3714|nr:molybdopterin-dependent oxidoreductase [Streptomyces sp. SBT349]